MQKENENLEQPKNQDYFSVEGVATGVMPKTKAEEPQLYKLQHTTVAAARKS